MLVAPHLPQIIPARGDPHDGAEPGDVIAAIDDAVTTFAGNMSEPLTAIATYLTAIRRMLENAEPADHDKILAGIALAEAETCRACETIKLFRRTMARHKAARLGKWSIR